MTVYLHTEHDGITIYEDVTYKNNLLQYINDIMHDVYNDSNEVMVELEMIYEDKKDKVPGATLIKLSLH